MKLAKRKKTKLPQVIPVKANAKVLKIDDICQNKEFCILNAPKTSHTTNELEGIIVKHGGTIGKVSAVHLSRKFPFANT